MVFITFRVGANATAQAARERMIEPLLVAKIKALRGFFWFHRELPVAFMQQVVEFRQRPTNGKISALDTPIWHHVARRSGAPAGVMRPDDPGIQSTRE